MNRWAVIVSILVSAGAHAAAMGAVVGFVQLGPLTVCAPTGCAFN